MGKKWLVLLLFFGCQAVPASREAVQRAASPREKYKLAKKLVEEGIQLALQASQVVSAYDQLRYYREAIFHFRQALSLFHQIQGELPKAEQKSVELWCEQIKHFIWECLRDRPQILEEGSTG